MNRLSASQQPNAGAPLPAGGILQRKCDCGQHTVAGGECAECGKKQMSLQRATQNSESHTQNSGGVPAIVHDVLRSTGQPLDAQTRAFMEPRFGHDFSRVRVHADNSAAESAQAVNAQAYTLGGDVVFGAGKYSPQNITGKLLLAHELTHVVQQSSNREGLPTSHGPASLEAEAGRTAKSVVMGRPVRIAGSPANTGLQLSPLSDEAQVAWSISTDEFFEVLRKNSPLTKPDPDLESWMELYLNANDLCRARKIIEKGLAADDADLANATSDDILLGRTCQAEQKKDPPPLKHAGDKVENSDKSKISEHLKKANVSEGTALAVPLAADFLLHDTSALLSAASIAKQKGLDRGLLGKGVAAYVPRSADATIARQEFFESRRPSTSEFEKATQTFETPADKTLKADEKLKVWIKRRDIFLRQVWNATTEKEREAALQKALVGLTTAEQTAEKKGDDEKDRARKGDDFKATFANQMKSGSTERIWTAGAWTVEEICRQASKVGAAAVAEPATDKKPEENVTKGCAGLSTYFIERNKRVSNVVAVEIVQPGVVDVKDKQKAEDAKAKAEGRPAKKVSVNVNTCLPHNPDIVPLSDPPYSDKQYQSLLALYLRAALIAGKFPRITTHFAVDAFIGGHCDPRCFNLTSFYHSIAATLGHDPKSTYGIVPSYGTKSGTNNVWWDTTAKNICKTKPPA